MRQTRVSATTEQPEELVNLTLDKNGIIKDITDAKSQHALQNAWLEPEILSLLGTSATRAQIPKALADFSPLLIKAVLATEDERFYHHFGLDPVAIVRAAASNLAAGGVRQGGSTITQQLAKNLFRAGGPGRHPRFRRGRPHVL